MRLIKTLTIYVYIFTYNIMFADNLNHTDYDYEIQIQMDSIRANISDSTIVETIHFNFENMYMKDKSSVFEYAYLFSYLFEHNLEEFDEPIAANIYEMFERYPDKIIDIGNYLSLLREQEKKTIKIFLMYFLSREFLSNLEYLDKNSMPTYDDLINKYDFLDEPYISVLYDEYITSVCDSGI